MDRRDIPLPAAGRPAVAVLVNPPTVEDRGRLRAMVEARCRQHGWSPPVWLETTPVEPGTGLTRRALATGADLVLCCGGDGTVMAAATALAGTAVPLALIPQGTGDVLARNLGIPLDVDEALDVAFTGTTRSLDLGRVGDRRFAVMAGLGFDAKMVGDVPARLKARLGWPAYVVSALRNLRGSPMKAKLCSDDAPPMVHAARTVVVGNVGRLQAGSRLLPAANPGDGKLDVAVIAPTRWWDWLRLGWRLLTGSNRDDQLLKRFQSRRLEIRTDRPQPLELDGEVGGPVTSMSVAVDPAALSIKVPR